MHGHLNVKTIHNSTDCPDIDVCTMHQNKALHIAYFPVNVGFTYTRKIYRLIRSPKIFS